MSVNENMRRLRFVFGTAYVGTVWFSYLLTRAPTENSTAMSLLGLVLVGSVFFGCVFAAVSLRPWWWGLVTLLPFLGPVVLIVYCVRKPKAYKSKYGGYVPPAK